jgi:hypothetical protein
MKINLAGPGKAMSDLFPMEQVITFIQGYPREKLKRTTYHVILSVRFANAWIRIETTDDWIGYDHKISPFLLEAEVNKDYNDLIIVR